MNEDTVLYIGLLIIGTMGGIAIGLTVGFSSFNIDEHVEERLRLMEMCQNEIFYNSDSNYKKCDVIGVVPQ